VWEWYSDEDIDGGAVILNRSSCAIVLSQYSLLYAILVRPHHSVHLFPYILQHWAQHNRLLPETATPRQNPTFECMQSNNFLTRLLYKNLYWHNNLLCRAEFAYSDELYFVIHCHIFCILYFVSEAFVLKCVLPSFNKPILIDWEKYCEYGPHICLKNTRYLIFYNLKNPEPIFIIFGM